MVVARLVTVFVLAMKVVYPIKYEELNRSCQPHYNCGPGSEILPCVENGGPDLCKRCPQGFVQPEVISSTGNSTEVSCFKPTDLCLDRELTYRRYPIKQFCVQMEGCKCNTALCYYGDPCLCNIKEEECGIGLELSENGECVQCKEGFIKNKTGCGPCLRSSQSSFTTENTKTENEQETITLENTHHRNVMYTESKSSNLPLKESNVSIYFVVIIVLSVILVAILLVLILVLRTKVTGCEKFPMDINLPEVKSLIDGQADNGTARGRIISTTENGNITSSPVDDKNSTFCPDTTEIPGVSDQEQGV